MPVGIPGEVQSQAVHGDRVHLQSFGEQRQQLDANGYLVGAGKYGIVESRRITEYNLAEFDADPGKHGQLDVAVDQQIPPGVVFDLRHQLLLVVVGID